MAVFRVMLFFFFFLFAVQLEVEMELVVANYKFTEDLENKSSPVYKETEKNFTTEVKHTLVVIRY